MFFTILFPLMFLLLFGGLFKDSGLSKSEVLQIGPVAMFDQMPAATRADVDQIVQLIKVSDREKALEDVRKGDYSAAVEQQGGKVVLHYAAADVVRSGIVRGLLESIVQTANLSAAGVSTPAFTLDAEPVEDRSLKTIQFVTPGILGWAIAVGATFGAAMTLVTWRQKKVLRRLRLSPVRTPAVVSARVGVSIGIALLQTAIFIAVASLPFFGLRLADYWWMSIPLIVAGTLAFLAIGQLAGSFTKTPEAASAVANLIVLPMAFLSGAFFPLQNAPAWINTVSNLLPLRHLVDGLLDVMVRGEGPAAVLPQLGILLGFAAVVGTLSVVLFKWDD